MSTSSVDKKLKKLKDKASKIEKFSDLLDGLDSIEDKKKMLWLEAYENAISDRDNASFLLNDLLKQVQGSVPLHTSLGSIMSKYLERMSKSNDQILRLAELIAKEQEKDVFTDDEIFNQINSGK